MSDRLDGSYESESVWESGYSVGVFEGEEKGIQEGRAQGIIEGIEKGIEKANAVNMENNLNMFLSMIDSGLISVDRLDEIPMDDGLKSAIVEELSKRDQRIVRQ